MLVLLFWISIFFLIYIYIGYPITIYCIGLFKDKTPKKRSYYPTIAIVISAYNEEKVIRRTIENKLALNYPKNKFSIIVISDASNDNTDKILKKYHSKKNVTLLRQDVRRGKTAALNHAVSKVKSEIIVFSDANSHYHKDALFHLVKNFTDSSVGYVTGKMLYTNPDGSPIGSGCSTFMLYENFLRLLETKCSSVVGVDGGIDAVRKSLYQKMPVDAQPDFFLPLKVVEQGFRVVFEPDAILNEHSLSSSVDEYKMRLRVSLRAFHVLFMMKYLLNPFQYGLFSFQLCVHKILRYIAGIFMIIALFCNLFLVLVNPYYTIIFAAQIIFYSLAFLGYIFSTQKNNALFYAPFYFVLLHVSSLIAFIQFLGGKKQIIWEPRKG